jgi:hypothetical protein
MDFLSGKGNNIFGYVFGGQVIKNINDLITGAGKGVWTKMSHSDRDTFIQYTCRVSASKVLSGEYACIDDIFSEVIPTVGQEYINWKQHSNNNTYMGWINKAKSEVSTARNMIESNNSEQSLQRLRKAHFDYVSKTQVSSIINGNYYDTSTDTETLTPSDSTINSAGFSFSNILGWAKANPIPVIGLGLISVIGLFFIVNRPPPPQYLMAPEPEKIGLKGLK